MSAVRFDHISPVMKDLHLLPVSAVIRLNPQSNYNLRSNTKHLSAQQDQDDDRRQGVLCSRANLWNALTDELIALGNLKTFMARLKAHNFWLITYSILT